MIIAKALTNQGLVPLRRTGVPQPMKGQRAYRAGVSDRFPVFRYEILQFPYGNIGVHFVRDEELVPRRGVPQGIFQCDSRLFAKRDFPDLSALSLDRENAEAQSRPRDCRIKPHAFVDSQTGVSRHLGAAEVVIVLCIFAELQKPFEFRLAPGTIYTAEAAAL